MDDETQLIMGNGIPAMGYSEGLTYDPEQPYFDTEHSKNITALLGKTAVLNCRVKNIGNKTVSWIRHRDIHLLTVGRFTYTSDDRFSALHSVGSEDWLLKIHYLQERDAGKYDLREFPPPLTHIPFPSSSPFPSLFSALDISRLRFPSSLSSSPSPLLPLSYVSLSSSLLLSVFPLFLSPLLCFPSSPPPLPFLPLLFSLPLPHSPPSPHLSLLILPSILLLPPSLSSHTPLPLPLNPLLLPSSPLPHFHFPLPFLPLTHCPPSPPLLVNPPLLPSSPLPLFHLSLPSLSSSPSLSFLPLPLPPPPLNPPHPPPLFSPL
ncbi:hypothetical protein C7M84_017271 [Penaeus vannamei]|uniref:Ig-like domain-containing protein n=1 Tax=Penaeus vannamei TaxID=6689 RepID=A0A423SKS0_PENVA|nr:hypothetical protein C7M84_017271 [Penaeus vannamei]